MSVLATEHVTSSATGGGHEPFADVARSLSDLSCCLGELDACIDDLGQFSDEIEGEALRPHFALSLRKAQKLAEEAEAEVERRSPDRIFPPALRLISLLYEEIVNSEYRRVLTDMLDAAPYDATRSKEMRKEISDSLIQADKLCTKLADGARGLTDDLARVSPEAASPRTSQAVDNISSSDAIRDLAVMMASLQTPRQPQPAETTRAAGRFDAVSAQMAATLDELGLPHDGVQFGHENDLDKARDRLVSGLMRNFAWKERDGFKVYYRTDAEATPRALADQSQLLRGSALVNANLLRAEADALMATIGRLPPMSRFEIANGIFEPEAMRKRVAEELNQLIETARDPLGINRARASFQYRRVIRTTAEYLEIGGVHAVTKWRTRFSASDTDALVRAVDEIINNDLAAPVSSVRNEEVAAELKAIWQLLKSIGRRVLAIDLGAQRGVNAARLEQALTAVLGSATALMDALVQTGTSVSEQDLQFVSVQVRQGRHQDVRVSIGQFLGWTQAVTEPFARAENRAATLQSEDLRILADELAALRDAAEAFLSQANILRFSIRLPGPIRQLIELRYLLDEAAKAALALV